MFNKNDIRNYFNTPENIPDNTPGYIPDNKSINNINSNSNICVTDTDYLVFTDGSSFNNGSKTQKHYGGIGVFFGDNEENISEQLEGKITNNIAELKACKKAIETITQQKDFDKNTNTIYNKKIVIYTDSEYVLNCMTKWCKTWCNNNWTKFNFRSKKQDPVKNKELLESLYKLYKMYNIKIKHIRAHQNEPINKNSLEYILWYGNKMADLLARKGGMDSKSKIKTNTNPHTHTFW